MDQETQRVVPRSLPTPERALDVILVIVVLMGGRVIPSFTANALGVEVRKRAVLDWASLASVGVVALLEQLAVEPRALGVAAVVAGLLSLGRLAGWRPLSTRGQPILWVLHVGYAWLAFACPQGARALRSDVDRHRADACARDSAIAVPTLDGRRAPQGHTGRMLVVSPPVVLAYAALTSAALRSLGPMISPTSYVFLLIASGVAWTLAFAIFTFVYAPMLIAPRIDGKPG